MSQNPLHDPTKQIDPSEELKPYLRNIDNQTATPQNVHVDLSNVGTTRPQTASQLFKKKLPNLNVSGDKKDNKYPKNTWTGENRDWNNMNRRRVTDPHYPQNSSKGENGKPVPNKKEPQGNVPVVPPPKNVNDNDNYKKDKEEDKKNNDSKNNDKKDKEKDKKNNDSKNNDKKDKEKDKNNDKKNNDKKDKEKDKKNNDSKNNDEKDKEKDKKNNDKKDREEDKKNNDKKNNDKKEEEKKNNDKKQNDKKDNSKDQDKEDTPKSGFSKPPYQPVGFSKPPYQPVGFDKQTEEKPKKTQSISTGTEPLPPNTRVLNDMNRKLKGTEADLSKKDQLITELEGKLRRKEEMQKVDVNEKSSGVSGISSMKNNTGILFSAKPKKDLDKIEEYNKEFISFIAHLKTSALGTGGMKESLTTQITSFRTSASKATTGSKKKYAYMNQLNAAKSGMNSFLRKNLSFLVDQGFRRKIGYLLEFDSANYKKLIGKLRSECIEPYFDGIESLLRMNFTPDSYTDDPDELNAAKEVFLESLFKTKNKIYLMFNNQFDIMQIFNSTFFVIYFLKAFRVLFIWFSLYLASKIFQQYYTAQVFANNLDPPDLRLFVLIYIGLELLFAIGITIFLLLLMFLYGGGANSGFIINSNMMGKYIMDYIVSTVFIVVLGVILASVMMGKRAFQYKNNGLRTIRALQTIMLGVGGVFTSIPFFMMV